MTPTQIRGWAHYQRRERLALDPDPSGWPGGVVLAAVATLALLSLLFLQGCAPDEVAKRRRAKPRRPQPVTCQAGPDFGTDPPRSRLAELQHLWAVLS